MHCVCCFNSNHSLASFSIPIEDFAGSLCTAGCRKSSTLRSSKFFAKLLEGHSLSNADRTRGRFWSAERRDALASSLGLSVVPRFGYGQFDLPRLEALLGSSQLAVGSTEGLYVRCDVGEHLVARAKLVRREFVQAIDVHWSKRPLLPNALEGSAGGEGTWR